jgi:hypothetical protein
MANSRQGNPWSGLRQRRSTIGRATVSFAVKLMGRSGPDLVVAMVAFACAERVGIQTPE